MASIKNSLYNAKVTPIIQKRRRKSDLVILWYSIYNVTLQILFKIHLSAIEIWTYLKFWFWHDEIHEIQTFLKQHLPRVPEDYSNSWRDGKLLCILLNKLKPGCIPEADHLDPNYGLRNMYHAFDVLESKFGIIPNASVEKLVVCVDGSDLSLLEILAQLKKETENNHEIPKVVVESEEISNIPECSPESENCVIKGTGLMVAFAGRTATFNISCTPASDINVVIEIKGPSNTICRERITKRSPRKKLSTSNLEQYKRQSLFRTNSLTEKQSPMYETDKLDDSKNNIIPLEYNIYLNQINVTYIPLVEGQHIISVLWYGHHVSDSPFVVSVESTPDIYNINATKQLRHTSKLPGRSGDHINIKRRGTTEKFQESDDKMGRIGRVINRRILRHIVKINGKDVVVDSNDIDHLAAALLKMDYDFQTDPSKSRRNSWGFTGDAERKTSVIRQFCVPPHEMEAQYMKLQRRSQSLSMSPDSSPLLKRSTSYETEDIVPSKRLETVSENSDCGMVPKFNEEREEYEEMYSYFGEDFKLDKEIEKCQGAICDSESVESLEDKNTGGSTNIVLCSVDEKLLHPLLGNDMKENKGTLLNASKEALPPHDLTSSSVSDWQNNKSKSDISATSDDCFQNREKNTKMNSEIEEKLDFSSNISEKIEKNISIIDKNENAINSVEDLRKLYCENTFEDTDIAFAGSFEKHANTFNFFNELESEVFIAEKASKNHRFESNYFKSDLSKEHICKNKCPETVYIQTSEKCHQNKFKNHSQKESYNAEVDGQSTEFSNDIKSSDVQTKHLGTCLKPSSVNSIMKTEPSQAIKCKTTSLTTDLEKTVNISNNSNVENFCGDSGFSMKPEFISNISPSLQFNLSELNFNEDRKKLNIQNISLISLSQNNFKYFNPSSETRESRISHKIKKFENTIKRNSEDEISKTALRSGDRIENVNLKAKLAFWENVYQRNQKENQEKKLRVDDFDKSISDKNNLQKETSAHEILEKQQIFKYSESEKKDIRNDFSQSPSNLHKEADNSSKMQYEVISKNEKFVENKLNTEISSTPKSRRSFSDPGILDRMSHEISLINPSPKTSFCELNQMSSTDNLSTSIDLESSVEDGLSSTDALISTEDEYIDDEIPDDSLLTYWGDLSLMKSMKTANLSTYKEYCHYIDSEILKNQYHCAKSYPSECKVFGIGAYFGYVAVKNQFQVLTKDAGNGNLSVSVQGFGKHDVGFVSVQYKNKDIYEVTYQVMRPGLYLISLRWMENPIVGSPFLCKITF